MFSADKSISRVHAEIMVDSSTGNIQIVDLASRYLTVASYTVLICTFRISILRCKCERYFDIQR